MKENRNVLIIVIILISSVSLTASNNPKEVQLPHSVSRPDTPIIAPKQLAPLVDDVQPLVRRKTPDPIDIVSSKTSSVRPKAEEKVVESGKMEIELKPDLPTTAPKPLAPLVDDVQPLVRRPKTVSTDVVAPIVEKQSKPSVVPESKPLELPQVVKLASEKEALASPKEITQAIFNKLLEQEKLKPENAKRYEEIEKLKADGYAASTLNRQKLELDKQLENKVENSPLYISALEQKSRLEQEARSKDLALQKDSIVAPIAPKSGVKEPEKTAVKPSKDQAELNKKMDEMQQLLEKSKAQRLAVIEKNAGITENMRNKQKEAIEKSYAEKLEALKKQATENPDGVLNKKASTYLKDFELKQAHNTRTEQVTLIKDLNTARLSDLKNIKLEDPKQASQLKKEVAKLERASKLLDRKLKLKQSSPTATEASTTDWYLKEQKKLDSKMQALQERALNEPESLGKKKSRMSKIKSMLRRK